MEVQSLSMRTIINYGTFQPILFPGAYCLLMFVQPEVGGDFLKGYNRGELQMV